MPPVTRRQATAGELVYGRAVPYARLLWPQMVSSPYEGSTLLKGAIVRVPKPGRYQSYVKLLSFTALVDNDQLEWLSEPARAADRARLAHAYLTEPGVGPSRER